MKNLSTRPKPVLEITSPARRRRRTGRGLAWTLRNEWPQIRAALLATLQLAFELGLALGLIAFLAGAMVLAYERGHSDKQAQAEQQGRALAARPGLYPSDYIAADRQDARKVTLVAGKAR